MRHTSPSYLVHNSVLKAWHSKIVAVAASMRLGMENLPDPQHRYYADVSLQMLCDMDEELCRIMSSGLSATELPPPPPSPPPPPR